MSKLHFDINRPIHLARRDVFFERSMELLYMPIQSLSTTDRIKQAEIIISMLKTAELHAFFAIQASNSAASEKDFLRFVKLISDNVQSAHSMLQHQLHLEAEESFLCQFLNATPEQCLLPALHYQRRADDIFQGLWHILQLAHTAYRSLQQNNRDQLNSDELERYKRAYASFRQDVITRFLIPGMTSQAGTAPGTG